MPRTTEHRAWARQHMAGVENTTIPSFTADLSELDEAGIRLDVRQAKAHGFFSTLVATESGVSFEEAKRLVSIVADEAGQDLLVSTTLLFDSFVQDDEMLRHAERAGAHAVLLGFPANWRPSSVEEIYRVARALIDSTSLAVVLYPSDHFNFGRLAESEFPLEVMHRLVEDCPNVIAIKIGNPGHILACHSRYGDRVLLGNPVERLLPSSVLGFGMQWMGAGCYEVPVAGQAVPGGLLPAAP